MTNMPSETIEEKHYRLAIRRPVTVVMIFLTLIVFGYKSYNQLPINLMPDISYPTLTVRTEYEGAAPEDVEKLLTRPLEETLSIVSGMVEISSVSSAGLSEIIMEFTWDTDMNAAQQDVRDRLDLFDPPKEVTEKPVILRYDPTLDPVLRLAITGETVEAAGTTPAALEQARRQLTEIREAAERHVKSDLEAEVGIAQVLIKGGREKEIQVLADAERLKNLGFTVQQVITALEQQNVNLSGGRLREGKTEYLVRTKNEWRDVAEIRQSIIGTANDQQVRLEDVAEVVEGEKERDTIVHIDGQEAVGLEVYKEGDANTVQVCNKLKDLFAIERDKGFIERLSKRIADIRAAQQSGESAEKSEEEHQQELARTLRSRLPKDAQLALISDQSRFIIESIKEVQSATVVGGILALVILFMFLRDLKSTLIIGVAIPISVIATFVPMFARHITLNIMSLGGLALGVGMLVDNSIVVLESIFRCREEGDGAMDAAERGTREVGGAVTASTLTTVAVFFPIAFVEGVAGQLFADLALTVAFSLMASLVAALYLIPMIASRQGVSLLDGEEVIWILRAYHGERAKGSGPVTALSMIVPRGLQYAGTWFKESTIWTFAPFARAVRDLRTPSVRSVLRFVGALVALPFFIVLLPLQIVLKVTAAVFITAFFVVCLVVLAVVFVIRSVLRVVLWLPLTVFNLCFEAFRKGYKIVLEETLRFSPVILLVVLGMAVHAGMLAMNLGRELIPPMKQGEFGINVEAPPGTRLEETERRAALVEAVVRATPEVESVTVEIGQEKLRAQGDRGENVAQFTVLLRDPEVNAARQDEIIERLRKAIARVSSDDVTFTLPALFSFKTAVEVQIRGDDLKTLRRIGEQARELIREVPGVKDAELSVQKGYPEVIIELDRDLLASKNLSPMDIAQRLRNEVQGDVATQFSTAGEKIDVRVRSDQAKLSSVEDLRNLSIIDGYPPIPLKSVAKRIAIEEGPSEIRRIDQRQVVLVTANVTGMDLGAVSGAIMERLNTIDKPKDYVFLLGGQNRELDVSYRSLRFALVLAVFLVYVVMACQFESMLHPAIVMFSVPLAFIGVAYVLVWLSIDLSVVVFIGGIVLAGIVVNDAIVLVDYINQLRARGMSKREAVVLAGQVRLRPIIMTTVTTVLGLAPMALYTGEGAEMRRPMAITVMAGLSSATILTLLIIPMVYYMFGGRDKRTEP
ncbi:MAG TPA: efflux RND transporter permease subunit [Candidatus Hydrogenedentes bacterium]|nr:efflux RND transporter permease subunit [Candidatus Hydrogenedentota bacterium]HPG67414.1 efflux RND transporter permease subunit [Candidatus Hydrogenedentota bacterium]